MPLTKKQVHEWFATNQLGASLPSDGRFVLPSEVFEYVQHLEDQMVTLATGVAKLLKENP